MQNQRVMKAWLKCKIQNNKSKSDVNVRVIGADGQEVNHSIPKDRIHPTQSAVLVMVFKDSAGFWIRFPTSGPYKPFRVTKEQLRKAK